MSVNEVANELISLCRQGQFDEAVSRLYAADIVSKEAMGDPQVVTGIDAVKAKGEWFAKSFDIHGVEVNGPFIYGDQFAVEFKIDATNHQTNERSQMHEIALYTVRDGKVAEEVFLYATK